MQGRKGRKGTGRKGAEDGKSVDRVKEGNVRELEGKLEV